MINIKKAVLGLAVGLPESNLPCCTWQMKFSKIGSMAGIGRE
jgi:hypothetical protein